LVPERAEAGGGFTLLDGAALVIGAAVASVHMRERVRTALPAGAWGLAWITFAGIAVSAAGPFVYLARRYGRRQAGYPRIGDWLWTVMGVPWILTALVRPAALISPATGTDPLLYTLTLWLGLAAACFFGWVVVWKMWVLSPPGQGLREGSLNWTERIGLGLAIAWPVQCGLGLLVSNA
jgi:hypothetical protein